MTTILDLPGEELRVLWLQSRLSQTQFARQHGISRDELHSKLSNALTLEMRQLGREILKPSPYPIYDKPLQREAESAVVIPDLEAPFHHADFVNRVLDLGDAWGVKSCIIAGDALHFDSFSAWEPAWKSEPTNGMTEAQEKQFLDFASKVKANYRDEFIQMITANPPDGAANDGASETTAARGCLERLAQQFEGIDYVIGNHDGRFLTALNSPLLAQSLLDFIGLKDPKWRIAPFYYSILHSGGREFYIEHPKTSSDAAPVSLANKYHVNVLMAHSHKWGHQFDASGEYHAIHMGCCVDELRLPYAAQRHNAGRAHKLGAVIVRDGWPWLLCDQSPWQRLRGM